MSKLKTYYVTMEPIEVLENRDAREATDHIYNNFKLHELELVATDVTKLAGKTKMLTDEQAEKVGGLIISLLYLKPDSNLRIATAWGNKTALGIAKSIERIMEELGNGKI